MVPSHRRVLAGVASAAALTLLPLATVSAAATASSWRPPATLSRVSGAGHVTLADLGVGPRGDTVAVWVQTRPGGYQVRAATRGRHGGWSRARALSGWFHWSPSGPSSYGGRPQVAVDRRGAATVVWSQAYGDTVRVRVTTRSASGRWSAPRWLSSRRALGVDPQVATSVAGTVVTWRKGRPFGDPRLLARYRPRGGGWTGTLRLDDEPFVQLGAEHAVVDATGRATVVWDEDREKPCCDGRVRVATYVPGAPGGWTVETLFERTNHAHQPQIDLAADGTVGVAWTDYDQILVARRAPGGAFGAAEQVAQLGARSLPDLVGLGLTATGGAVVGWTRLDLDTGARGAMVSAQTTPGSAWTRERVSAPAKEPFFTPFFPSLAVDAQGGATMTWQVQNNQIHRWYRAYVRHRTPSGTWGRAVRLGRVTSSESLGTDASGTVTALWLAGRRARPADTCCTAVQARVLPAGG